MTNLDEYTIRSILNASQKDTLKNSKGVYLVCKYQRIKDVRKLKKVGAKVLHLRKEDGIKSAVMFFSEKVLEKLKKEISE